MSYVLPSLPPVDVAAVNDRIAAVQLPTDNERTATLHNIIRLIDLTTLKGTDNDSVVTQLCETARGGDGVPPTAAVCVYPPFVRTARKVLHGTNIRVASVAGAFPSGHSFLSTRILEVQMAVANGADEIDTVINRGAMLVGDAQHVYDELCALKDACGSARLKVILETGELQSLNAIRQASDIAIAAGADFIKTSTGMAKVNATLPAMVVMLHAIKAHHAKTGEMVGIKPAGGIRTADDALPYYQLVHDMLGKAWLSPDYFRFGASSLRGNLLGMVQSNPEDY